MLLFLLGVFVGAVLLSVVMWWCSRDDQGLIEEIVARRELQRIERPTVAELLAASSAPAPRRRSADVIEGTATEIEV